MQSRGGISRAVSFHVNQEKIMETEYQRLCRIAEELGIDITQSIMQLCEEARRLGYNNGFADAMSTTEKE